jgi:hypothetical protein
MRNWRASEKGPDADRDQLQSIAIQEVPRRSADSRKRIVKQAVNHANEVWCFKKSESLSRWAGKSVERSQGVAIRLGALAIVIPCETALAGSTQSEFTQSHSSGLRSEAGNSLRQTLPVRVGDSNICFRTTNLKYTTGTVFCSIGQTDLRHENGIDGIESVIAKSTVKLEEND